LQEDVDVVGLSILSGAHMALIPRIREVMDANELSDVPLVLGGIIPDDDREALQEMGVSGIFGPGANTRDIVVRIKEIVAEAKGTSNPHG
jgi:methylmalonyl-CoA mutase C-terminal domain/subunit